MSKEKLSISIPSGYVKMFFQSSKPLGLETIDSRLIPSDTWVDKQRVWISFYAPEEDKWELMEKIYAKNGKEGSFASFDPREETQSDDMAKVDSVTAAEIASSTDDSLRSDTKDAPKKLTKADIYNNTTAVLISDTADIQKTVKTPSSSDTTHLDTDDTPKINGRAFIYDNSTAVLVSGTADIEKTVKTPSSSDTTHLDTDDTPKINGRAFIYDNRGLVEVSETVLKITPESENSHTNAKEMEQLITKKLIPLIENYQKHLIQKAEHATEVELDKIAVKQRILESLLEGLKNKEQPHAPERVRHFYSELNKKELELSEHRDPEWTRFVKNAVICGGILLTGILPGLIALIVYANMDKNTPSSMQFWNSQGKNVVDALQEEQPQSIKSKP